MSSFFVSFRGLCYKSTCVLRIAQNLVKIQKCLCTTSTVWLLDGFCYWLILNYILVSPIFHRNRHWMFSVIKQISILFYLRLLRWRGNVIVVIQHSISVACDDRVLLCAVSSRFLNLLFETFPCVDCKKFSRWTDNGEGVSVYPSSGPISESTKRNKWEIYYRSRGDDGEDYFFLRHHSMQCCRNLAKLRRIMLLPFSGKKRRNLEWNEPSCMYCDVLTRWWAKNNTQQYGRSVFYVVRATQQ
jgi:hypothetical protein